MDHTPTEAEQATIDRLLEQFRCELVPLRLTKTMLEKSIMDARAPLRALLHQTGVVEYGAIQQGQEFKIKLQIEFVSAETADRRLVSFYRPPTKQGDPRIWVERLGSAAQPNDLLLFAFTADTVVVVLLNGAAEVIARRLEGLLPQKYEERGQLEAVIRRLAEKIIPLRKRWVRTLRPGPTGVGLTLESLLDIKANVSQLADVDGVELKAYRRGSLSGPGKLVSLFAKTPRWLDSQKGSGLLERHGYRDSTTGRLQLYCSIFVSTNTLGWRLNMLPDEGNVSVDNAGRAACIYSLRTLAKRLAEKHPATLFIKATSRGSGASEEFLYDELTLCREPSFANFVDLIDEERVCLDFTLSQKPSGQCRDHGYLWRIREGSIKDLYAYRKTLVG